MWCDMGLRFLTLTAPWREALDLTESTNSKQPVLTMRVSDPLLDGPKSCPQTMVVPDTPIGYDLRNSQETGLLL